MTIAGEVMTGAVLTGPAPTETHPDRPLRTVSLRRRVTLWVLLLLLVVLTGMGLVVNWLLGDALRSDLKQRLEDKAGYAAVLQEQGVTGQTLADRLTGNGVLALFRSGNEQYVGQDQGPVGPPPGSGRGQRPAKPTPAVAPSVTYSESGDRLDAAVILRSGVLTLSTTENDITNALGRLRQIEMIVGAGTIVLTGMLLVGVVRAALRPLERMSELARRVRTGTRGRRLRPTNRTTDLGRTAVALDDMLDALESAETQARAAEEQMRRFLADASHDLRTPLAGVIAGAEQLLRSPATRSQREDRLVQVVRQARRAARLVDDLLLMTRLDATADGIAGPTGAARLARARSTVDPGVLIGRELDQLQLRRPDLQLTAPSGRLAPVWADADQLQRAIANLLDNAAAATPVGGAVTVAGGVVIGGLVTGGPDGTAKSGRLIIRVMDTGQGVPDGDRERIFDRFVRLSDSRHGGGTGLGLPISRAIVRADGGDLRCLPWQGGGCFEMTLPIAVPALPGRTLQFTG